MQLLVTGCSGFVGQNLRKIFEKNYTIRCWQKHTTFSISDEDEAVIHLAGKAHDLKSVAKPEAYYQVNTELTKQVFDSFLESNAKVFIMLSSVKAVADQALETLDENHKPQPATHYGKSKLLAEQYICSKTLPKDKRVYLLRPCMIHGPGNKGNLNLLYSVVEKGWPWPLGAFDNQRSFLSIDNLLFVIKELMDRTDIPSGIYHIADDIPLSTNELIRIMGGVLGKKPRIVPIPQILVKIIAGVGGILRLPLNNEKLQKLTESYVVSNQKLIHVLGKPLPVSAKDGLIKTVESFKSKN